MITIGVTGWRDHDILYQGHSGSNDRLKIYSGHFPVVEVDSSFYAHQPQRNYEKWCQETPQNFSFVIKAYQGMTGHQRGESQYKNIGDMFDRFIDSIQPVIAHKKLKAVLFQYPPWFDCRKEHVDILRYTRKKMGDIPVALEFRHQSWFKEGMREKTLAYMEKDGWIHTICDEPQVGEGSIPTVLQPTNQELTLIRLHGRNTYGWLQSNQPNWREVRYLYRYTLEELLEWKEHILQLQKSCREICILFNNNSGGDAARNAKELIQLLGIEYTGLAPRQLELF